MVTPFPRAVASFAIILAIAVAIATPTARAGDASTLNILGFSADGSIFAFEEYGVQDGSGFPFANRFYIDTTTDTFVPGTPIRHRIDDEAATMDAVRLQAQTEGEAIVADAVLADNRGFTAGANAITELSADPWRMAVNPRPVFPPIDDPLEVRLTEKAFAPREVCAGLSDVEMGFSLVAIDPTPGGQTQALHDDQAVPASRNCPLGYAIGGIQTFHPDSQSMVYAVLIAVRTLGFEGPNHRWMAVTARTTP